MMVDMMYIFVHFWQILT
uniref:Uncharacterized protein n=1 Tax=Anguilla anguilla TaxID=7936 RepID=A0A0E9S6G6_ANGAN